MVAAHKRERAMNSHIRRENMCIYKKIWIGETTYKIRQYRDDGSDRWVDVDHAGYLRWLTAGHTPEEVPYVPPVVPADDDPDLLRQAKRRKIREIRAFFLVLVEENYDPVEISIRNMKAIDNLSQSKAVGAKFTNMLADLAPYITWRNTKVQAVRACALVSEVQAIQVTYP